MFGSVGGVVAGVTSGCKPAPPSKRQLGEANTRFIQGVKKYGGAFKRDPERVSDIVIIVDPNYGRPSKNEKYHEDRSSNEKLNRLVEFLRDRDMKLKGPYWVEDGAFQQFCEKQGLFKGEVNSSPLFWEIRAIPPKESMVSGDIIWQILDHARK